MHSVAHVQLTLWSNVLDRMTPTVGYLEPQGSFKGPIIADMHEQQLGSYPPPQKSLGLGGTG